MESNNGIDDLLFRRVSPELIRKYETVAALAQPLAEVNTRYKSNQRVQRWLGVSLQLSTLPLVLGLVFCVWIYAAGNAVYSVLLGGSVLVGLVLFFRFCILHSRRLGGRNGEDARTLYSFRLAVELFQLPICHEDGIYERLVFLASEVLAAEDNLSAECALRSENKSPTARLLSYAHEEMIRRNAFECAYVTARDQFGLPFERSSIFHAASRQVKSRA
jgi:hypothetical protein